MTREGFQKVTTVREKGFEDGFKAFRTDRGLFDAIVEYRACSDVDRQSDEDRLASLSGFREGWRAGEDGRIWLSFGQLPDEPESLANSIGLSPMLIWVALLCLMTLWGVSA